MSKLLKEAIADAKVLKQTAIANAKIALEEAFTPTIKSMLSAKLREDDDEFEDDVPVEEDEEELEDDVPVDEDDELEDDVPGEEVDEDVEIAARALRNLDAKQLATLAKAGGLKIEQEDVPVEDDDEEEVEEIYTVDESLFEEDEECCDDDEENVEEQEDDEEEDLKTELGEYKKAVEYLKDKLYEVNLLNAKLLYTNKLFRQFSLDNSQKMKVVETFDRAQTTREIKLVYSTLAENFKGKVSSKKTKSINEVASRKAGSTRPKRKIITEEQQVANRFRQLAGIIK
tara:strand:- start:233 stop:1090 length:858 start_codon:yes stop_codon:yes gene_type:complete